MTEEYGHIPDAFYLKPEEVEELRKSKKELTEYGKEKLRKMNQQSREQAMKTAMEGIHKYDGDLKALAATEKEELKQELEALKKKNFQKVADCCMDEYRQKYGEMPEDEYWMYMVADYGATGEGQTYCLMITQALPRGDDYGTDDTYRPINTKQYRAVREFHEQFGTWMLHGIRFVSREDFHTSYAYFIPPVMMKLSNGKCYKNFYTQIHYNFS